MRENDCKYECHITHFHVLTLHTCNSLTLKCCCWIFTCAVSQNSMLWQTAMLVYLFLHKWERTTDAIPAKLQVIGNLTLKGKKNPSKESLHPLLTLGSFKNKTSTWDLVTDPKDSFVLIFKVNMANMRGLHVVHQHATSSPSSVL